ncbi:TRAFAC clade GTPase domain-containing protein [Actinomycetospora atypica]|uniref:Double-GTPase 2 domain-containing protein n=1 Tax=Actinomycetospora atypica TaxID=1290095 RepID=A0ABV9YQP5_9PSEU
MNGLVTFLAIVGALVWGTLVWLFYTGLVIPLAGWGVLLGLLVGALVGGAVALTTPFRQDHRLISARDTQDEAHFRRLRFGHQRDHVWPHYLARQATIDLEAMAGATTGTAFAPWAWLGEHLGDLAEEVPPWIGLAVLPFAAPFAAVLGLWSVGVMVGLVIVWAVSVPVLLGALAVWGGFGWGLRRFDELRRRRRRARASCPICFHRTNRPSYACRGERCDVIHRDVRPSRLGVLSHRCRCGTPMPTTVSRAGLDHVPQCPYCDHPLEAGSGVLTDVSIPVLGPASAGKTSLIYAGLAALQAVVRRAGGILEPGSGASERSFEEGVTAVRTGHVAKTEAGLPTGLVARLRVGRSAALLHTFDAAGERFADHRLNRELGFLDSAEQMIAVVDPFSIRRVADQVPREMLDDDHAAPARSEPVEAYRTTVQRLVIDGVDLRRVALAVVVVKADLLVELPVSGRLGWSTSPDSAMVRDWLERQGQDDLVREADRDFAEVRYFFVSSVTGVDPDHAHSAAAPLLWLGRRAGIPLPDSTKAPA